MSLNQNKVSQKAIQVVERQRKAVQLRTAGLGLERIARECGYKDASGAYRAIQSALKRTLQEPTEELRTLERNRLDRMTVALWDRATKGDVEAVDRIIRIMARRAKLLGLDAPAKVENQNYNHEVPADALDLKLAALAGRLSLPHADRDRIGLDPSSDN